MNKLKGMYVVWAILVVLVVVCLCYMGFVFNKANGPYKSYEKNMEEATKKYVELNFLYPEDGETLKIDVEDLITKELFARDEKFNENCAGYTEVTFNGVYNYKAYIKCDNYTTNNYKK